MVPHAHELGDDAYDVQVRAVGEEEVPEAQDLGKGRCAGAQGQDARERVELGGEALGEEVAAEARVDGGEDAVDEG